MNVLENLKELAFAGNATITLESENTKKKKCGKCGRKLTTPESIKRGFGPECFKL